MPFLVVLAIVVGCRDINYPSRELSSDEIGGIGELNVAFGKPISYYADPTADTTYLTTKQYERKKLLDSLMGTDMCWNKNMNSDDMWLLLRQEYYLHGSKNRWGSYVMDDIINDWFESSVTIEESSLNVDIDVVFESIKQAGRHICGLDDDSIDTAMYQDDDIAYDDKVNLCGPNPSIEIRLVHYKHHSNDRAITISMYNALNSNLTMMSNVTTDHAAPIFLKEIVPKLIGAGISVEKGGVDAPRAPTYTLYSHPLPQVNLMNQVYVERGYLGATMIVLYMLLLTTTSVRFITKLKRSGNKTQLKIAGMHNVAYWLGNYISDTVLIILSLLSLVFAIFIGGHSSHKSLTHSLTHSLAYSLTHSLTHSLAYSLTPR